MSGSAEDATGSGHGANRTSTHAYIGRNQIFGCVTNASDWKGYGGPVVISQNTVHDFYDQYPERTSGTVYSSEKYIWKDVSGSPDFSNVGAGSPPYTIGVQFTANATAEPTSWGTATVYHRASSGPADMIRIQSDGEDSSGPSHFDSYPEDMTIVANTFYNGTSCISTATFGRLRVVGNVIYNLDSTGGPWPNPSATLTQAVTFITSRDDCWFSHNTIYGTEGGIRISNLGTPYSGTGLYFKGYVVDSSNTRYTCTEDLNGLTFSVDAGTNVITTSAVHGFSVDDHIGFTSSGGVVPAGMNKDTNYRVETVPTTDTMTIKFVGGGQVDITGTGSGTLQVRGIRGIAPPNASYWRAIKLEIIGNIIAGRTETQYDIKVAGYNSAANAIEIDHNLVHYSGGEVYEIESDTDRDLAYVIANTAYQTNGLDSDPLFTNAGANDYTLQGTSPAIGAAVEGTAYDDFFSRYGISIQYDLAGNARPQGGSWDMGAFEFVEGGGTGTINATTGNVGTVNVGQ